MRVTKCADFRCPSRATCWRFQAPAAPEQDFADYGRDRGFGRQKCPSFIDSQAVRRRLKEGAGV